MSLKPPVPPELDGFLLKLKANPSVFGSWVKRYFRVNPKRRTLEYFHSKPGDYDDPPRAFVRLDDIFSVSDFGENQFQVQTNTTSFMLQAESNAELRCWVNDLSVYLERQREFLVAKEVEGASLERAISKVN